MSFSCTSSPAFFTVSQKSDVSNPLKSYASSVPFSNCVHPLASVVSFILSLIHIYIEQWLNLDEGDSGSQILSHEEIAESVLHNDKEDGDDDDDDEETSVTEGPKLSAVRNSMDETIAYIGGLQIRKCVLTMIILDSLDL